MMYLQQEARTEEHEETEGVANQRCQSKRSRRRRLDRQSRFTPGESGRPTDSRARPSVVNCTRTVYTVSEELMPSWNTYRCHDGEQIGSEIIASQTGDKVYQQDVAERR